MPRGRPRRQPIHSPEPAFIDLTECEEDQGDKPESPVKILATINGNQITDKHCQILLCEYEWLNDEIVNSFSARVSRLTPDVHCCSSFFFTKLSRGIDVEWLERWKNSADAPRKRLIFVPVNWGNSHWALLVYNVREAVLNYYDSMMNPGRSREALAGVKGAFEAIKLFPIKDEEPVGVLAFIMSKMSIDRSSGEDLRLDGPTRIKTETPKNQPQQTDGSSCGVYLCWWVEKLANPTTAEHKNTPNIREYRRHILDMLLDQR